MKKTELRQNAEAKLSKKKEKTQPLKKIDTLRMVHELQVHQIELEMQNDELVQKRMESEALLRQYTDLYDFVPLGYLTLTRDGMILMSNLTGANLLGVDRKNLIKRRFGVFVSAESRSIFNEFLERVFISGKGDDCEIMLLKDKTDPLWVRLDALCSENHLDCRIVMKDVTERKQVEEKMLESQKQYQQFIATAYCVL
jgi:PAS domain-containing protein